MGDSSPPGAAAPTETFSAQSPLLCFSVFSTLAVAQRRLGPTSSASISTAVRVWPSGVSHERDLSRPITMTRMPFVNDSATFSPSVRHAFTRKNEVSPSFHCPDVSR
jgi:hypothetical protein